MASSSQKSERIQTVVFLRHGVAKHNVIDPTTGKQPVGLLDPPLIVTGKTAAVQAGCTIQSWWKNCSNSSSDSIELIVTSPLTRCLQTTTLAFLIPPADYDDDYRQSPPTVVCKEDVREAFGMNWEDRLLGEKSLLEVCMYVGC